MNPKTQKTKKNKHKKPKLAEIKNRLEIQMLKTHGTLVSPVVVVVVVVVLAAIMIRAPTYK